MATHRSTGQTSQVQIPSGESQETLNAMSGAEQYTLNKGTGLYVSDLAEEELENPFQQDPEDEVITDSNTAAAAVLMNRHGMKGEVQPGSERHQKTNALRNGSLPIAKIEENSSEGFPPPHIDGAVETVDDTLDIGSNQHGSDPPRRRSSSKRTRNTLIDAISGNVEEIDPEARRLAKRARRDSHAILIRPGDDTKEEDAKMRANLIQHGILPNDDVHTDDVDEEASSSASPDEPGDPTDVEPAQDLDNKRHQSVPKSAGDDYDDVEAKRGDDYDPDNYVRFEDDEDDVEEEIAEDGPGMDERLMIDEEQFLPGSGDETPGDR